MFRCACSSSNDISYFLSLSWKKSLGYGVMGEKKKKKLKKENICFFPSNSEVSTLGPLHMSLVERGGRSPLPRFRFFQPGSRQAGWKILPYEHRFSPVTRINKSRMNSSQQRMRSMVDEVARTRFQDFRPFFMFRNRAEISHMNPRRNWSR